MVDREIVVTKTARILKQAEPGSSPVPPGPAMSEGPPATFIAVIAGIVAFIAMAIALAN